MNENVITMARLMRGCKYIACEDCLSQRKRLFGDNECALIENAKVLDKAGYRKQSDTVKEFAQKAISRVFEGITQRFCDCYNDGLHSEYPDSELSRNFLRAFDECKDIAEKEINDLAEQFGKED